MASLLQQSLLALHVGTVGRMNGVLAGRAAGRHHVVVLRKKREGKEGRLEKTRV
jgi:hypothetical protein